jgi:hypothetical protein
VTVHAAGRRSLSRLDPGYPRSRFVTHLQDLAWVLLLGLLLPLWMLLALGALVAVIARQLYLWARGNTTARSRPLPLPRVRAIASPSSPVEPSGT